MQQPPQWELGPPSAPPRRSNVVLIVVLSLLGCVAVCCLGGGLFLWRLGVGDVYSCYDLTSKGKYHDAIPPCRALVAKTPDSGAAHNHLGWNLALDGQLPEALTETRKAVDIEPNYTHYDSFAMAVALSGKGEESMKVERDYILVNGEPRNDAERLTLGMVHYANGDKAKAREEWERAKMSPDEGTHKLAVEFESRHS